MVVRSKLQAISVKGVRGTILRLNKFQKNIFAGQGITGRELMQDAKQMAKLVIQRKKAPVTTGMLADNLHIIAAKTGKGNIKHELVSNLPYSDEVHSGRPPKIERNITPGLLQWVENNLGAGVAASIKKKGFMRIGFPSGKRRYNPQVGMRFFDEPFAFITGRATKEYMKMVDVARKRARL